MKPPLPKRFLPGLLVASILLGIAALQHRPLGEPLGPAKAAWPYENIPPALGKWALAEQGVLPMPPQTPSAHASNLLAMPKGHRCAVMAFWFAGTRESAPDVQIASSCFERSKRVWQAAQIAANRHSLGAQLGFGVRRLGNPVAWLDAQGRIHLFVVATGLGGWAASRIVHVTQTVDYSNDPSKPVVLRFDAPSVLPLSWLWNISYLVRGAPLPLDDGGFVLPVYFELGIKSPVALRFDAQAQLLGITRMSGRTGILQPSLIALNPTHWLALMRDNRIDGKIAVVQSTDAGEHWRDLRDLNLINPDASVVALPLGPWQSMLAHNSSPKSRQKLDLSESGNGLDWVRVETIAQGDTAVMDGETKPAEFSYPAMAWADGSLWISFTDNRQRIAWQRWNPVPANLAMKK